MESNWIDLFADVWKRFKNKIMELDLNVLNGEDLSAWEKLFLGKLVPHLEREGCLIVAVAGGTNTGKSTILNVLMKQELTATDPYAAATKRPVIIASEQKAKQCLDNNMFLEFEAREMKSKEEAISDSLPNHILLVKEEKSIPNTYLYLDTPDIDSIAKEHWEIADKIVSAGDIIIAVTNDSKYMDDAVIKFFRHAYEEGKIVIPVMNKVDIDNPKALQIADKQIREFMKKVGMDDNLPRFYFPKYPYNENYLNAPIKPLTEVAPELREYIYSFPVQETKVKILEKTISSFQEKFGQWYKNKFLKLLDISLSKVRFCEDYLENTIISREFIPFRWIRLVEEIKYELRKHIGYFTYLILFPTSIFSGYRSEIKKLEISTEGAEVEIKQKHNEMIEKCFNELLDWLLKLEFSSDIDYIDENINKRLHELHNNRDVVKMKIITRMENALSVKPEWIQKEIEKIVADFLDSPNLNGFYGKRIMSFLLLGAGMI
ncbi:MAG: dynamin family protein, partial [Candidatus Hydrogenedens sp.]